MSESQSLPRIERDEYPRDLRGAHDYWKALAKSWGDEMDRLRVENAKLKAQVKLYAEICRTNGWPEFAGASDEEEAHRG